MNALKNAPGTRWLSFGGGLSAAVAALHLAIIFIGAPAYRYFGAGEEMALMDERGSLVPGLVTLVLTLIFAVWAAFAFSGAGILRRLPLLRTGLVAIGSIYTLRGLALIPEVALFLSASGTMILPRQLVFSCVSFVTGVAYLIGTRRAWQRL